MKFIIFLARALPSHLWKKSLPISPLCTDQAFPFDFHWLSKTADLCIYLPVFELSTIPQPEM